MKKSEVCSCVHEHGMSLKYCEQSILSHAKVRYYWPSGWIKVSWHWPRAAALPLFDKSPLFLASPLSLNLPRLLPPLSETPADEQPTQKEEPVDEDKDEEEEDEEEYHYVYEDEEADKEEEEDEKKETSKMSESQDEDKTLQEVKGL